MRYSRWKQRLRRETKGLPLEQGLSLRRWPLSRAPSRPGSEPRGRLGERAPGGANKREGAEAPTPAGLGISREAAVRKYPGAGDAGQRKGRQEATSQRAWGHSSNRGLYPGKTPCGDALAAGHSRAGAQSGFSLGPDRWWSWAWRQGRGDGGHTVRLGDTEGRAKRASGGPV